MQIGMIGLERMGANMVRRLLGGGHQCVDSDRNQDSVKDLTKDGATGTTSLDDFVAKLKPPRSVWLQLSFWDQKGSRVIRGNLIAVPIESSFLYVVPVYLTAEGTDFPQLKRVIMISGDKVAMEPTLYEAIQSVFGMHQPQNPAQTPRRQLELGQARGQFDEAQKAMQQGDWRKFGKTMDALKRLLTGATQ